MKTIFIIILALGFSACSVFQSGEKENEQTKTDEKGEEVYVFDAPETDSKNEDIKKLEKELDKTLSNKNKKQEGETDVFDEPSKNTYELNSNKGTSFYLQLGAFSTLKSAEQFVNEIESQVMFQLSIIFNTKNSLYTVRSSPFATKPEVERIRDNFWSKNLFTDSFIVTE